MSNILLIMNFKDLGDQAVLKEIGSRIREMRLNRNLTQAQLGEKTGLARRTVQNIENGDTTTLATLVTILRGLDLLARLDLFFPEPQASPISLAKLLGKKRLRATGENVFKKMAKKPWKWRN